MPITGRCEQSSSVGENNPQFWCANTGLSTTADEHTEGAQRLRSRSKGGRAFGNKSIHLFMKSTKALSFRNIIYSDFHQW